MQKLVLASLIDEDLVTKLNIAKSFMDQIKVYVNPEFFWHEHEQKEDDQYDHKNALFEHQSSIGRSTGKLESPSSMKTEIANFYKNKDELLSKRIYDDSEILG